MRGGKPMQDELRDSLENFINTYGVRARFICKQTDIPEYLLCRFRHGKQKLDSDTAEKLNEWISARSEAFNLMIRR